MATVEQDTDTESTLRSLLEESTDKLLTCVHCGLCLPSCPTYRQLGNENDSPRGRIYLMRNYVEGRVDLGEAFVTHIDLCLGCRGCEKVCPSNVPYGSLLEAARVEVANSRDVKGSLVGIVVRFVLNQIFTRKWLLSSLLWFGRLFRDSGLARMIFDSGLRPGRFRLALGLLLASRSVLGGRGQQISRKADGSGDAAQRVAVLRGCVMEGLFAQTNRATERVLVRNGCKVVPATGQGCCGALHAHAGQLETAKKLA